MVMTQARYLYIYLVCIKAGSAVCERLRDRSAALTITHHHRIIIIIPGGASRDNGRGARGGGRSGVKRGGKRMTRPGKEDDLLTPPIVNLHLGVGTHKRIALQRDDEIEIDSRVFHGSNLDDDDR